MTDRDRATAELRTAHARFATLVEPYRRALHRYCSRMTGSVLDGEDIVQDTLAHASFRLPQLPDDVPLRAWLFTIAHHKCVDFLRARRSTRETALDDDTEIESEEDTVTYEDRDLASRMFSELVLALPPRERAAVILKDLLGYSLDEVATILETSVGGIKAALHRGRGKLAAADDVAPPRARPPTEAVARYVAAFNRRDWPALLAILGDDVSVELVGHAEHHGRDALSRSYLATYTGLGYAWRIAACEIDGEPVLVCMRDDGGGWTPRHAIRIEWRGERVTRIRDYAHVDYVLSDATIRFDD